ncbi:MAG: hypothetical protein C5B59_14225 [Bacteroidetes bacterium]|nr:MAG: hypothetical protein C5B59_14225 [Bacteroidota bacterium]
MQPYQIPEFTDYFKKKYPETYVVFAGKYAYLPDPEKEGNLKVTYFLDNLHHTEEDDRKFSELVEAFERGER